MSVIIFPRSQTDMGKLLVIILKAFNKKQNLESFKVILLIAFGFQFFLIQELRHNPYTIKLFHLEFLVEIRPTKKRRRLRPLKRNKN